VEKDTEKTKVIFRFWKASDNVIAIFPELCGTNEVHTCQSYEHLGQHGSCNPYMIVDNSRLAKPEEYADLKAELENHCGYNLEVIKRNNQKFIQVRREQLQRV